MGKLPEYLTIPKIHTITIHFQDLLLEVKYNSSFKDGVETPFVAAITAYIGVKWEKLTM